jgi:8-oxo-dGTP pyrophosphatase MutT (NUDIX family)
MSALTATVDAFGGIVIDSAALPSDAGVFGEALAEALAQCVGEGYKVVWLEVPIGRAALIPVAVEAGFAFHHSGEDYLMLTRRLVPGAFIPPYASHYIGAGGVVLNGRGELLVVWERAHRHRGRKYYKLPGGALHQGEHLVQGVIREVEEETGIRTRFEGLACFRHWHGYRFGKSDIYFVCRLAPLTEEIHIQEAEIAECLWMPVAEYLASEEVGEFNKRIVEAALDGNGCLVPTEVEGYSAAEREVFMPRH